jgi:Methyltransferase domain
VRMSGSSRTLTISQRASGIPEAGPEKIVDPHGPGRDLRRLRTLGYGWLKGFPTVTRASLVVRAVRRIAAQFRSSTARQRRRFTSIYESNEWGSAESVSGIGSTLSRAADFQADLVDLIDRWQVGSIVDAPCGDMNWMRNVLAARDVSYTGVDIVEPLIARVARDHAASNRRFICADMTRDDLPAGDLLLCRDGLVHLSFADARAALRNFKRSGCRYLLTTTFAARAANTDVPTGDWRVLNLEEAPFRFPPPLALIDERCSHSGGIYRDKRLALWELAALDP